MKTFLTGSLLLLQLTGLAQSIISGRINAADNTPLPYATIVLLYARDSSIVKGTVSDTAGRYQFEKVSAGNYLLLAQMTGFVKAYQPVSVPVAPDNISMTSIVLAVNTRTLKQVEVTANKPYIEMMADKTVLNVENNMAAAGNTLFELLRRAPGLSADKDDNLTMMGKKGLEVWINGRPSFLSGEALINWLKSQPAETVSKMELITQPSSRYDAAGGAGIINIRTKANPGNGLNGTLYAAGGIGRYVKGNAGTTINYRQNKWNLFGNYGYNYSESYNQLNVNSTIITDKGEDYANRNNYWHPFTYTTNFKGGVDYQLGARTTLGLLLNGTIVKTNSFTDAVTTQQSALQSLPDYLFATTDRKERMRNFRYNLNLASELDTLGSSVNADIDVATYRKGQEEMIENRFARQGQPAAWQATIRNLVPADVDIFSVKADYTRYFGKPLKLETGFRISQVKTDSDIRYDSLLSDKWTPDLLQSSHFRYTEQIQAVYVNLTKDWPRWSLQAGLRAERTVSDGTSFTLNQVVKQDYISFFPSFFLLHKISDKHQLTYSFSRRIDRPSYQDLNPFTFYIDPYSRIVGNPYLAPQFSNSGEIKYGFRQFLFASLQYSRVDKAMNDLVMLDSVTNILTKRSDNNGRSELFTLNLTTTLQPFKWWQLDATALMLHTRYTSTTPGYTFLNESLSVEASIDQTFSLKQGWKLQLTSYYNTPGVSGQYRMIANFSINVGIQKSLWDGNGRIRLYFQDPLNRQRWDSYIVQDNTRIRWTNRWENRRITLSFNWKFGNNQVKTARNRTGGAEQERGRVNL